LAGSAITDALGGGGGFFEPPLAQAIRRDEPNMATTAPTKETEPLPQQYCLRIICTVYWELFAARGSAIL
jgi:hypothetical protein